MIRSLAIVFASLSVDTLEHDVPEQGAEVRYFLSNTP